MNDRKKQTLKISRRDPLIRQNEIASILQVSHSRAAARIMDLVRKGLIKDKGYILTGQDYCVIVDAINMSTRGMVDIRYPQAVSHPGSVYYSAGGVGRNITYSLALLDQDVHLILAIDSDFCGETLLGKTRRTDMNASDCIHLHGHNTATYLTIASKQEKAILTINDIYILRQLAPQLLGASRDLIRHAGVVLTDHNLTPEALEWVFIIADEIPMSVDTVSEFEASKVKN